MTFQKKKIKIVKFHFDFPSFSSQIEDQVSNATWKEEMLQVCRFPQFLEPIMYRFCLSLELRTSLTPHLGSDNSFTVSPSGV
jgi:hypothetical protein